MPGVTNSNTDFSRSRVQRMWEAVNTGRLSVVTTMLKEGVDVHALKVRARPRLFAVLETSTS
jgi:hypothetical protein